MTLAGTRPPTVDEWEQYELHHRSRMSIKPGITGMWQAIGGIQKCADQFVDCSPFEVLAYFRNAEEVITDTFHGSIFSIITHRPFTTLIRKSVGNSYGNEEKLSDLLKRLELNTRMTTKIESVENINEQVINYEKIDEILKTHRKVARQYLQKNLEG